MSDPTRLAFIDSLARHYARRYSLPPMVGRVFGWLLICDPPDPTIAELSDALLASRTAISSAVGVLEEWSWVRRSRASGQRVDRVSLDPDLWLRMMDSQADYATTRSFARMGLEALGDAPGSARSRLLEMEAFSEFLIERMPALHAEWQARRDALHTSAEMSDEAEGS